MLPLYYGTTLLCHLCILGTHTPQTQQSPTNTSPTSHTALRFSRHHMTTKRRIPQPTENPHISPRTSLADTREHGSTASRHSHGSFIGADSMFIPSSKTLSSQGSGAPTDVPHGGDVGVGADVVGNTDGHGGSSGVAAEAAEAAAAVAVTPQAKGGSVCTMNVPWMMLG